MEAGRVARRARRAGLNADKGVVFLGLGWLSLLSAGELLDQLNGEPLSDPSYARSVCLHGLSASSTPHKLQTQQTKIPPSVYLCKSPRRKRVRKDPEKQHVIKECREVKVERRRLVHPPRLFYHFSLEAPEIHKKKCVSVVVYRVNCTVVSHES